MRVARVQTRTGVAAVSIDDGDNCRVVATSGSDDPLLELIQHPSGLLAATRTRLTDAIVSLADVRLLSPLHRPGKIIAVGLNYVDHAAETGLTPPAKPLTFAKYPSSLTGPCDDIVIPMGQAAQVDYEAELAVVIGRHVGPDGSASLADVAAYTVANDVSARDVQFGDQQWTRGKSFDTFTPLGPWLVTADSLPNPHGVNIWTDVNGERRQDDTTASMIFDIPAILAHLSSGTSLEPGDVIVTGTPSGAGAFQQPPRFLTHGDIVEVGVEGIGVLRNTVRHSTRPRQHQTRQSLTSARTHEGHA